ncbi:MAG: YopX family protein [Candidatus Cryptobacteroides sp.]
MREIIFRGKRLDNGKFVEGDLSCSTNGTVRINPHENGQPWLGYPVNPETVGQYTGLTDKNGVKIFEGDILSIPSYNGGKHKSTVYFAGGKFAVDGSNYSFKDIKPRTSEVIGNIYDNPKLVEQNDD